MLKIIINLALIVAFALVTFFGIGPILFADGGIGERVMTLIVVIIIYAVLIMLFKITKKIK